MRKWFLIGLVPGLGFASVLADKLKDGPRNQLALPLFGFNYGVEFAQISVLVCALLVVWPLQKWTRQMQTIGSVNVALAGIGWMVRCLFFQRKKTVK